MKRLSEMIFDDSSSLEEEEDDDDFEMAIVVLLNEGFLRPRLRSQFICLYINRDRAEVHGKLMKYYLNPNPTYPNKYFVSNFGCTQVSFSPLPKPLRSMMIGLSWGGVHHGYLCEPTDEVFHRSSSACLWMFGQHNYIYIGKDTMTNNDIGRETTCPMENNDILHHLA